jgi:hypothetical protein
LRRLFGIDQNTPCLRIKKTERRGCRDVYFATGEHGDKAVRRYSGNRSVRRGPHQRRERLRTIGVKLVVRCRSTLSGVAGALHRRTRQTAPVRRSDRHRARRKVRQSAHAEPVSQRGRRGGDARLHRIAARGQTIETRGARRVVWCGPSGRPTRQGKEPRTTTHCERRAAVPGGHSACEGAGRAAADRTAEIPIPWVASVVRTVRRRLVGLRAARHATAQNLNASFIRGLRMSP